MSYLESIDYSLIAAFTSFCGRMTALPKGIVMKGRVRLHVFSTSAFKTDWRVRFFMPPSRVSNGRFLTCFILIVHPLFALSIDLINILTLFLKRQWH